MDKVMGEGQNNSLGGFFLLNRVELCIVPVFI
jgi:hypothetical protein